MGFDCTKPLGEDLVNYFGSDLAIILNKLLVDGIVYEGDPPSLYSMVIKMNASDLVVLFSKRTDKSILYNFSPEKDSYVFYDTERFTPKEAIEKLVEYCNKTYGDGSQPIIS